MSSDTNQRKDFESIPEKLWTIRKNLIQMFSSRKWVVSEKEQKISREVFLKDRYLREACNVYASTYFWDCMQIQIQVEATPCSFLVQDIGFPNIYAANQTEMEMESNESDQPISGSRLVLMFKAKQVQSEWISQIGSFLKLNKIEGVLLIFDKKPGTFIQDSLSSLSKLVRVEVWTTLDLLNDAVFHHQFQTSSIRIYKASDLFIVSLLNTLHKKLDHFPTILHTDPVVRFFGVFAKEEPLVFEFTYDHQNASKMYRVLHPLLVE